MRVLKQDKEYKYYALTEKNCDDACYWRSDVVAISKDDLKWKSAKDALMDGDVIPCEYDCVKNPKSVLGEYMIDPSTITFMKQPTDETLQ